MNTTILTDEELKLTPYYRALRVYEQEACARTFEEDLLLHLFCGFVVSNPDLFIMARPVHHGAKHEDILNPRVVFTAPDCWHVYCFAGDVGRIARIIPFHLEYVSYERNNVLRFHKLTQLLKKL